MTIRMVEIHLKMLFVVDKCRQQVNKFVQPLIMIRSIGIPCVVCLHLQGSSGGVGVSGYLKTARNECLEATAFHLRKMQSVASSLSAETIFDKRS